MWNCHLNRNQDLFSRIMEERCQRHFRNYELPLPSHAKFQCLAGAVQFQRRVFGHLGGLGTHCQHCLTTLFPAFQYSPPWMPQVQLQWAEVWPGLLWLSPRKVQAVNLSSIHVVPPLPVHELWGCGYLHLEGWSCPGP